MNFKVQRFNNLTFTKTEYSLNPDQLYTEFNSVLTIADIKHLSLGYVFTAHIGIYTYYIQQNDENK